MAQSTCAQGTVATLVTTFTNPTPAAGDMFGWPVAAVGADRVLIGSFRDTAAGNAGAAYLFNINGALLTTFTNSTPQNGSGFGISLAAVGTDRVLIGASGNKVGAVNAGAAYLFSTNGTLLTAFTNPTPAASDSFGYSVAGVGSDRVLIGAHGDDTGATNAGAAYLFSTNGTFLTTFANPTPEIDEEFGRSVAAVGTDRVLIGAHGNKTGAVIAGAAYLFSTSGTLLTTFTKPTPASYDSFGYSVTAVGSDRVLIGDLTSDIGATDAGAAYLFSTGGTLLATLTNPTPAASDDFGVSVAAVGTDRLLIGAYGDNTGATDAGAAYLFSTNGALLTTFTNPTPSYSDVFGWFVAAVGTDRVLIGTPLDNTGASAAGAAYLYLLADGSGSDVSVDNIQFAPPSLSAGQNLNITFRVRNLGTNAAPRTIARLRLTSDAVLSETDPGLLPLDINVTSMPAGGLSNFSANVAVPVNLLPGTYHVGVWIDPDRALNQVNRANDIGLSSTKLTVVGAGGPSLYVAPASQPVGSFGTATSFAIRNSGGGSLTWSATTVGAPWLHFAGASGGTAPLDGAQLNLLCDANPSTSPRTGSIVITAPGAVPSSQTVTVNQASASPLAPEVTHFEFSPIVSPQAVNSPFAVTIRAMNTNIQPPQVQTAFNGSVDLSEESAGSVTPKTVELRNGVWSGNVRLNTPSAETRLAARGRAQTQLTGLSGPFVVNLAGFSATVTLSVRTSANDPVAGAIVTLRQDGAGVLSTTTDAGGFAYYTIPGAGSCFVTVEKSGFLRFTDQIQMSGTPIKLDVKLRVLGKRPVIFVPGMMGSCTKGSGGMVWEVAGRLGTLRKPQVFPLLPQYSPGPSGLMIFNPDPWTSLFDDRLGWTALSEKLAQHYQVYEAPWDWRIPVIRSDGGKLAWQRYLEPIIQKAKAETGHTKVDVVAHSTGGLLTRAYINSSEYADDIEKFAMVGTPNEGSAKAYYLWFGGDTSRDDFYEKASKYNYEAWNPGMKWSKTTPRTRQSFYHTQIKALEELLPVYFGALRYDTSALLSESLGYPGYTSNPLYELNQQPFGEYDDSCPGNKVCAIVSLSESETTINQIRLQPRSGLVDSSVWPHGTPKGAALTAYGDGTVPAHSALLVSRLPPWRFPLLIWGEHPFLVKVSADDLVDFLDEGRTFAGFAPAGDPPSPPPPTNQFVISLKGRGQTWVLDPQLLGAGTSPVTGAHSNSWPGTTVEASADGAALIRSDAPSGLYQGTLSGFSGEIVSLSVQLFQTNRLDLTNATWIVSTNPIVFSAQLDVSGTNGVQLLAAMPAPSNARSLESNGVCRLAWEAPGGTGVEAYRIYSRRDDESLFQPVGTTTNFIYDTGVPWARGGNGTNWFFAVVSVGTNGVESPCTEILINNSPTVAGFTADVLRGTPPLAVTFTNQSQGGATNWTWDFDGDGSTDSTVANPAMVYAQPGSYTVSLTITGPDGQDERVAVGFIEVFMPVLQGIRVLPDQTVEMDLSAQAGRSYEIQASENLTGWTTLMSLTATNDVTTLRDLTAAGLQQRFYRVANP